MAGTAGTDRRIVELMEVEAAERDLDWLKASLQSAIDLEFATLPVYLSGLWSIKDQSSEVFSLVDSVIREEMLHLGLVCNLLKAIGGSPKMNVPSYPGELPGGVRPGLRVFLAGLSLESVAMYMEIEKPENPLALEAETFATIGLFYDAILEAFQRLSPSLSAAGQLSSELHVPNPSGTGSALTEPLLMPTTLAEVQEAIATIKDQGEGTSKSPDAPEFGGELAHFYRFGEIHAGRRLVPVDGRFEFAGDPVPFPPCEDVAEVPPEGYPDLQEARNFDRKFTELVKLLEQAWAEGDQGKLDDAVGVMFGLRSLAKQVIAKKRPDERRFGPDFKLVP